MPDIPYGLCHCGCGQTTDPCPYTARTIGWVKGEPKRYIHGHQSRKPTQEYQVDPDTGCWVWQRYVTPRGYGLMRPYGSKRMHHAHRVYYERAKGPIPEGMTLDHLCHTNDPACPGGPTCPHRRCVNPDHLEACGAIENAKRGRPGGAKPGRPRPELRKTHCKHGHEFTPENTIIPADGARRCRACQNKRMLAYYRKRKAAGPKPGRP